MTVGVAYYWGRVDAGLCVENLGCKEPALPGHRTCEAHRAKRRQQSGYKGAHHGGPVPKTVEYNGETLTVAQWATRMGVTTRRMRERLASWPAWRALGATKGTAGRVNKHKAKERVSVAKPVEMVTFQGRTQSVIAWAKERGISPTSMYRRLKDYPMAEALTMPPGYGRTGRPRGKPPKGEDWTLVPLPKGGDHCGRCGLRGEHECLPDISVFAAHKAQGYAEASMDFSHGRKGAAGRGR